MGFCRTNLFKRLEKYRKNVFMTSGAPPRLSERVPLEAVAEIPDPEPMDEHEHDHDE